MSDENVLDSMFDTCTFSPTAPELYTLPPLPREVITKIHDLLSANPCYANYLFENPATPQSPEPLQGDMAVHGSAHSTEMPNPSTSSNGNKRALSDSSDETSNIEDDFTPVRNAVKPKPPAQGQFITVKNRWSLLHSEDPSPTNTQQTKKFKATSQVKQVNKTRPEPKNKSNDLTNATIKKPPPIVLDRLANINEGVKLLTDHYKVSNFRLRNTKAETKIFVDDMNDYNKLVEQLPNSQTEFHTYAPRGTVNKTKKFIIHGLVKPLPIEEIQAAICEFPGYITCFRLTKTDKKGNRTELNSIVLVTDKSFDVNAFAAQRAINHVTFTISPFTERKDITQCFKCQSFGHTARGCHRAFKCVRCGENHPIKDCPYAKNEHLKCANCNKNHVASFRQCEVRQRLLAQRANSNSNAAVRAVRQAPPPPPLTRTFLSAMTGSRDPFPNLPTSSTSLSEPSSNSIGQAVCQPTPLVTQPNGPVPQSKQAQSTDYMQYLYEQHIRMEHRMSNLEAALSDMARNLHTITQTLDSYRPRRMTYQQETVHRMATASTSDRQP